MKAPRATVKPTLHVALVDVCEEHCRVFKEACAAAGYSPVFKTTCNVCAAGLGRWADLVVIESDLCFRALHSAEGARRCGTCPVGVLVNWWSDLERDASDAADFVLHVPLTAGEIRQALVRAVPMRPDGAEESRPCPRARRGGHSRGRGLRALGPPIDGDKLQLS